MGKEEKKGNSSEGSDATRRTWRKRCREHSGGFELYKGHSTCQGTKRRQILTRVEDNDEDGFHHGVSGMSPAPPQARRVTDVLPTLTTIAVTYPPDS